MKQTSSRMATRAFVILLPPVCGRLPATAHPTWTIGMSQCNLGEPWRVQMNADIRKAAADASEIRR